MPEQTFFYIFMAVIVIISLKWSRSRAQTILSNWAADSGVEILSRERRTFFRGPFFWSASKGQEVFYVQVRDRDGSTRSGWVRCGGWLLGLMSNQADVRWE
ncbi:hypothetical protein Rhal01_02049 [Rubritalea halochordaticola]|uniref:DUF3301 domain-containing protein n=1 Tax=Rubritalea halochordaticola TaxID=714537 RepID=A0ABP9V052_9BACT